MENQPPSPPAAAAPIAVAETALDANGFNPHDFEWHPIPRRHRSDGWTHQCQRKFIEALADTGTVRAAAQQAGMSEQSCYRLRRSPGAERFAAAWDAAIVESTKRLIDIAFDRALNGTDEAVLDKDGRVIHLRTRINDRLLMFLLRAHNPGTYAPATASNRGQIAENPALQPTTPAFSAALDALAPALPENPHLLLHPEDLKDLITPYQASPETVPGVTLV